MNKALGGHRRGGWAAQGGEYEYRVLRLPPSTSRGDARRMLTEHAEYGRWELARTRLFAGGERKVWLRRKAIRVRSTLDYTADVYGLGMNDIGHDDGHDDGFDDGFA